MTGVLARAVGRAVVLVLVPAVCGTAGVASAGAAAPSGPTLTAHPEQVRPGEAVAVTGAGWSRPATPPEPVPSVSTTPAAPPDEGASAGFDGVKPAALSTGRSCRLAWPSEDAAGARCTIEGDLLSGTLRVPGSAEPGRYVITAKACKPCSTTSTAVTVLPAQTTVPDLGGDTYEQATQEVRALGLSLASDPADPDPQATVAEQSPAPRSRVDVGSVVSASFVVKALPPPVPDEVLVPDLSGQRLGVAERETRRLGLVLDVSPSGADRGRVRAQTPAASTSVPPGTRITVVLQALEQTLVVVPRVIGLDRASAERAVARVGLVLRVAAPAGGRVVTQQPPPHTRVPRGSVVGVGIRPVAQTQRADGLSGLLVAGLLVAAALAGAGGQAVLGPRRRHGRGWVRSHVNALPVGVPPEHSVATSGPSRSVALVAQAPPPTTDIKELR